MTSPVIPLEANEAKIVVDAIWGTKRIWWGQRQLIPFQAGTPTVQCTYYMVELCDSSVSQK